MQIILDHDLRLSLPGTVFPAALNQLAPARASARPPAAS
jgi:hypothetical protein